MFQFYACIELLQLKALQPQTLKPALSVTKSCRISMAPNEFLEMYNINFASGINQKPQLKLNRNSSVNNSNTSSTDGSNTSSSRDANGQYETSNSFCSPKSSTQFIEPADSSLAPQNNKRLRSEEGDGDQLSCADSQFNCGNQNILLIPEYYRETYQRISQLVDQHLRVYTEAELSTLGNLEPIRQQLQSLSNKVRIRIQTILKLIKLMLQQCKRLALLLQKI